MPDPTTDDTRDAFEAQVWNALTASMQATSALWQIYSALHTENAGGGVSWDRIEDNVWKANEATGFAHTYVQDDVGVVAQFKTLTDWSPPATEPDTLEFVTVYVNGEKHAVPVSINSPDAFLREVGYDPEDYILYWSDLSNEDPITDAPFVFGTDDEFSAYPRVVEY